MNPRLQVVLTSLGVLLIPVLLMYPALALANFGPCGPTSGWSLMLWAVSALGAGTATISSLLKTHQHGRGDWVSFIRFPVWIAAGLLIALTALISLFALPSLIFDIATHVWWFLIFLVAILVGAVRLGRFVKSAGPRASLK